MDIRAILLVGLGSFLGGALRFMIAYTLDRKIGGAFPWSIVAINALGSFLIGFVTPWLAQAAWSKESLLPLFVSVGLLGGFTTFSTFSLQTLRLMQDGAWGLALANALGSVIVCLVSVFLGLKIGESVWA